MFARSSLFAALFVSTVFATGCSSSSGPGEDADANRSVTLRGSVGAPSTIGTRIVGNGKVDGSLHVSAHELHARGAHGRNVEGTISADGTFKLDLARGSRWVVTLDDAENESAIVSFGNGSQTALEVTNDGDAATVDIGRVSVDGSAAHSAVRIDGAFGLRASLARTGEVFLDASGALIEAEKAIAEAERAVQEALAAAAAAVDAAEDAAEAARRAAEAARY
jgi:hypothetical protein